MHPQADGSVLAVPRMTAAGVGNGANREWVQQQAVRRAQHVIHRLRNVSSKVHNLAGALEFLGALFQEGGVYQEAREVYSDPWWGHLRLQQHMYDQHFYDTWLDRLLRLQPAEFPGQVAVMYGNGKWGAQRGHAQAPVRAIVRRVARVPQLQVYMVDEFRTSSTYWETGEEISIVACADGSSCRQLVRVSDVHGPAHYQGRDRSAAIQILMAGILPARLPHLCRQDGQQAVNKDVQSRKRRQGRPRATRAEQAAVWGDARIAARTAGGAVAAVVAAVP
jgi:hypothetical protein